MPIRYENKMLNALLFIFDLGLASNFPTSKYKYIRSVSSENNGLEKYTSENCISIIMNILFYL